MTPLRGPGAGGALAVMLAVALAAAAAEDGFAFMPDGGRGLVLRVFGPDPATLADLAALSLDAEGWGVLLAERGADLSEAEAATLAGYLALNLPLPDPAALAGLSPDELASALPPDGKDLAIRHCQFCHGFYSGYLGHDRDVNGWLVVFNSPFHSEIRMSPAERRTFAAYSAANLPIPIEAVPPDLRF